MMRRIPDLSIPTLGRIVSSRARRPIQLEARASLVKSYCPTVQIAGPMSTTCSKPPLLDAIGHEGSMGAIVQSYNHQSVAFSVIGSLATQAPAIQQVLVYDDASTDGSQQTFLDAFRHYQNSIAGSLYSSPDNHEIRNYNFGMEQLSRDHPEIQYYALMQDDDVLNDVNDPWALRAIQLFEEFPRLCVLGGYIGWYHYNGRSVLRGQEYLKELYVEEPSYNEGSKTKVRHTCSGAPFQFVMGIASSPMVVRKECYHDIGPLSELYTQPGDPGVLFDMEYSARAWANGWQVGLFYSNYTHGVGGHGTMASPEKKKKRDRAMVKGNQYLQRHYRSIACHYTNLNRDQLKRNQIVWK